MDHIKSYFPICPIHGNRPLFKRSLHHKAVLRNISTEFSINFYGFNASFGYRRVLFWLSKDYGKQKKILAVSFGFNRKKALKLVKILAAIQIRLFIFVHFRRFLT